MNMINEKVKFYAKEIWGLDFNLPVKLNSRYKAVMGSMEYEDSKKKIPKQMNLALRLFDGKTNELSIDDVIIHELCHWYCSVTGKESKDKSKDFETELKRIGACSTRVQPLVGTFHFGKCKKCGKQVIEKDHQYQLQKYLNNDSYLTICCHSKIVYGGICEMKDNHKVTEKIKELNKKFKEYWLKKSA